MLYAASALFAIATAQWSSISLYQQWGRLAVGPYALGAVICALRARRMRRRAAAGKERAGGGPPGWHWTTPRMLVFLIVFVGATLGPLALEVLWRTDSGPGTAHVQPEVSDIEQSGDRLATGKPLYRDIDSHRTHVSVPPGQPRYNEYDPYLPLMSVFGLPSSTHAPRRLTDARVAFSLITILLVVAALALCRGPTGPRVLALQAMTVFPTAALPLATGGDDLPIAAFLLLGMVLVQRRRPLAAGVTLGVAASMKITAWPLALLAPLVARDAQGRRGRRPALWLGAGLVGVMVPSILPTVISNAPAFFDNVVRFPLGLAGITSPAASPLLGHALVSWFPGIHRLFTLCIATVGGLILLFVLVRHTPRKPADLCRLLAVVMAVAIVVAPATRIGYALYPVDFFVWAWLLRAEDGAEGRRPTDPGPTAVEEREPAAARPEPERVRQPVDALRFVRAQSSSLTAKIRRVKAVLVPAATGPAPKVVGSMVTPASHSSPSLLGCWPTIR